MHFGQRGSLQSTPYTTNADRDHSAPPRLILDVDFSLDRFGDFFIVERSPTDGKLHVIRHVTGDVR